MNKSNQLKRKRTKKAIRRKRIMESRRLGLAYKVERIQSELRNISNYKWKLFKSKEALDKFTRSLPKVIEDEVGVKL